jgi:predicted dehydrogenase
MTGFRWAIVGTGEVAAKFVIGLRSAKDARAALVVSRSAERGNAFAAWLGIPRTAETLDAAAGPEIDAVYIATPPSAHRSQALAVIAAGKPVLIEKPFAANLADAHAIAAAAGTARVFCMEGMWTRFLPALGAARTALAEGAIGTPRSLFASFAKANVVDPADSLFDPARGGGVLGHRGVYPIALALDLAGPGEVVAAALTKGATGVEEEASALIRHDNGVTSTIYAGARTDAPNGLSILGTEGNLSFLGPIYRPFGIKITTLRPARRGTMPQTFAARLKEGAFAQGLRQRLDGLVAPSGGRAWRAPYLGNGYAHEAIAVMDAVRDGRCEHPLMPLAASLAVAQLVDDIKARGYTA